MPRRARKTADVPASRPKRRRSPQGVPPQRGVDVWPILSEPEVAAEEIAKGAHDECIRLLYHLARSQNLEAVVAACEARVAKLEG